MLCAAARAVANSLLELRGHGDVNGVVHLSHEVEADFQIPAPRTGMRACVGLEGLVIRVDLCLSSHFVKNSPIQTKLN